MKGHIWEESILELRESNLLMIEKVIYLVQFVCIVNISNHLLTVLYGYFCMLYFAEVEPVGQSRYIYKELHEQSD